MNSDISAIINIIKSSEDIDKDIIYKLVDIIKISYHEDIVEINDSLLDIFKKYHDKYKEDHVIWIEYINIMLVSERKIDAIMESNNFLKQLNKDLHIHQDIILRFIDILNKNVLILSQINYIILYDFLVKHVEIYINIEIFHDFLNNLFDQNLIPNDSITKFLDQLTTYRSITVKYYKLRNLYIGLLQKIHNIKEAYSFSLYCIQNNYEENVDFYTMFIGFYDEMQMIDSNIIDHFVLKDVAQLMINRFEYNTTIVSFYLHILEKLTYIDQIFKLLEKYIEQTNYKSPLFVDYYVDFFVKYIYVIKDLDVIFANKILNYYKSSNIESDKIILFENLVHYKSGNVEEFINNVYGMMISKNIVDKNIIDIFVLIFNNYSNKYLNESNFKKWIYIVETYLDKIPDHQELFLIKIKLMSKYVDSLKSLYVLLIFIKTRNYDVKKELYDLFIPLFKKHVDNIDFVQVAKDVYMNLFARLDDDLTKDINFFKDYVKFMYNINEINILLSHCEEMFIKDLEKHIYKELVITYIDAIVYVLNTFSNDQMKYKSQLDIYYLRAYKRINRYVDENIHDGYLVYKYANLLMICERLKEAYVLLRHAITTPNISDLFWVYKVLLQVAKLQNEHQDVIEEYARKLVELNQDSVDGYIELAKILYIHKENKESLIKADNLLKKAFQIDPHNIDVVILYAKMLARNYKFDMAIEIVIKESKKVQYSKILEALLVEIYDQKQEYDRVNRGPVNNIGF